MSVCQAPLRATVDITHKTLASKLAQAPDETGKTYVVLNGPEETDGSRSKPTGSSWRQPQSWIVKARDTVSENMNQGLPVVHEASEPRDGVFVVGAGATVATKPIEVFIRSLRATGCRAEVVAFIDKRCIASFLYMNKLYGGIKFIAFDAPALEQQYRFGKAVVVYRFALYEHYLRNAGRGRYRRCLHADLFDAYFQRDPFEALDLQGGLALFSENPLVEMAACRYHRMWFGQCREWELLSRAHGLPRLCMGVVMGTTAAFLTFLQLTLFRMLQHCNDQGVLNILASSGQFAEFMPVTVYTARWGPVIHINTDWDFNVSDTGLVSTPTGQAYAIVHQWDRIAKLHPREMSLRPVNRTI